MNTLINAIKDPKVFCHNSIFGFLTKVKTIRKTKFLLRKQLECSKSFTFTKDYTFYFNPKYMASIYIGLLICFTKITLHFEG